MTARLAVALLFLAASAMAQPDAGTRPSYQPFRYDEDWSFVADPAHRSDWFDPLKYVSLGPAGWYLTIGGEIRERYELLDQPGFGVGPADQNGYFLQRYLLSSDFHFGARVRVFTELQSGLEDGRNGGPRLTDVDRLDVHQAFLEWKLNPSEAHDVILRVGRQELGFGSGRLIAPAEGLNLRRSMDGARLTFRTGKLLWNVTALRLVKSSPGILDDVPDHKQSFWGGGFTAPHPVWRDAHFALYYIGLDRKDSVYEKAAGRGIRHTVGTHSWKKSGAWDFDYEGIAQWGSFRGLPIRAWAFSGDIGYKVVRWRFQPRFGVRADIASGDGGVKARSLGSFDPLFAAAPVYSGPSGLLGPTNLIDFTPSVRLQLKKTVSLGLESSRFWRESLGDGLYTPFVTPVRIGNSSQARYVATAPSATVSWQATRHLLYSVIYSRFFTGSFFERAPPDRNVNYVAAWVSFRF
ncbi:MAG: alginate export family protein [Acidobacteriia bacterium]|nr:alginate export family protein [Terriglobia bacterium]